MYTNVESICTLHGWYSVIYMAVWKVYLFRGHMPIMRRACISVFLVTLLITVTSYEANKLTYLDSSLHLKYFTYVALERHIYGNVI